MKIILDEYHIVMKRDIEESERLVMKTRRREWREGGKEEVQMTQKDKV